MEMRIGIALFVKINAQRRNEARMRVQINVHANCSMHKLINWIKKEGEN